MISTSNDIQGAVLPTGSRVGRYEVLAKLASGGMAVVYVARVSGVAGFQRLVALKILHANLAHEAEFVSMFLDEARLAARIRHPNVVATLDIGGSSSLGYHLVMDYIEGGHVGRLVTAAATQGRRIPARICLRIIMDALAGLGAAHDLTDEHGRPLNLVHRDVSPHNVLVGVNGSSRLTDFGVAKAEDRITNTRQGQVKGKLAYMAPEQATTGALDRRSDLFAAGIILWECLCGRRLFRADSAAVTLNRVLHAPIPAPSEHDPALAPLDGLLARALCRDPSLRFPNAESFIAAVERVAPEIGGVASQREVSRFVKLTLGARLDCQRLAIRRAEQSLDAGAALEEMEPAVPSCSDLSQSETDPYATGGTTQPKAPRSGPRPTARPIVAQRQAMGAAVFPEPSRAAPGAQAGVAVPPSMLASDVTEAGLVRAQRRLALSATVLAVGVIAASAAAVIASQVWAPARAGLSDRLPMSGAVVSGDAFQEGRAFPEATIEEAINAAEDPGIAGPAQDLARKSARGSARDVVRTSADASGRRALEAPIALEASGAAMDRARKASPSARRRSAQRRARRRAAQAAAVRPSVDEPPLANPYSN